MDEIPREARDQHITALKTDLMRCDPAEWFPWAMARIFNELLKQTKLAVGAHPIINTIASVKENTQPDVNLGASNARYGTVVGLLSQLEVALATTDSAYAPAAVAGEHAELLDEGDDLV